MTPLTTLRAQLPCPSCGSVGPRTVATRTPSSVTEVLDGGAPDSLPEAAQVGIVSDCDACWSRRADRIATARHRLQATGELTSLGPGREDAWLGVPLSRCEADFECAFASGLLKTPEGEFLPPPRGLETLDLAKLLEQVTEPELIEA